MQIHVPSLVRFRPHHTTIAAYGALFVALGGTSYAAMTIPAHSVGTQQLKNGAVTRSKLSASNRPYSQPFIRHLVTDTLTSQQVLDSLAGAVKGQPGVQGDPGATGTSGPAGPTGKAGVDGGQGPQGIKGDQGSPGPAGTSVGSAYVAADGTSPNARYITVARTSLTSPITGPNAGVYCITTDKGVLTTTAAVVTPEGNGTAPLSAVVQRNPASGVCAGRDFQVTTLQGSIITDEAFFIVVS